MIRAPAAMAMAVPSGPALGGVHPGDPLEISVNEEGALVISKHQPSCHICGSMKYIATYKGLCLCRGCHIKMGEALDNA